MKKFLLKYSVLLFVLLLGACSSDDRLDTATEDDGYFMQITLDLEGNTGPQTRVENEQTEPGEDILNENRIETVNIVLFNTTTDEKVAWIVPRNAMHIEDLPSSVQKKLLIRVPEGIATSLTGSSYQMAVVANGPSSDIEKVTKLSELRKIVVETELNPGDKQVSFLMTNLKFTGLIEFTEGIAYDLGSVELKRAASKVRIKVNSITADGYTVDGTPQVAFVHYPNKTALLPESGRELTAGEYSGYMKTDYIDLFHLDTELNPFWTTTLPFYSYENNWKTDDGKETYLIVKVNFKAENSDIESVPYYYRISLNNLKGSTDKEKLLRNHLYNINVNIEKLGKEDSQLPLDLEAYVSVEPWEEIDDIQVQLEKASFLVVKENDIIMANVAEYKIEYLSSSKVRSNKIKATFKGYDENGNIVNGVSRDVTVDIDPLSAGKTYLTIKSPIPINYVPLNIEIFLENDEGLKEVVKATQYPPRYITAKKSNGVYYTDGNGNGPSSIHKNFNLFTITTLVPREGEIIGDPQELDGFSGRDKQKNKLISPQFIIASQYGVTSKIAYETAYQRCHEYYEDNYGPGRAKKGYWRLPSRAEIEYIQSLQSDGNSAVKNLLKGSAYWSAFPDSYFNFDNAVWVNRFMIQFVYREMGSNRNKTSDWFPLLENTQKEIDIVWSEFNSNGSYILVRKVVRTNSSNRAHTRCVYDVYKYVK